MTPDCYIYWPYSAESWYPAKVVKSLPTRVVASVETPGGVHQLTFNRRKGCAADEDLRERGADYYSASAKRLTLDVKHGAKRRAECMRRRELLERTNKARAKFEAAIVQFRRWTGMSRNGFDGNEEELLQYEAAAALLPEPTKPA